VNRLVSTLALALLISGCAKNTSRPSLRLNGPTGVAVYRGHGISQPGKLRPLLAVANTRGDDLRIIDAVTDQAEISPALVGALSVPTDPRPSLVVAGRLGDLDAALAPLARPDLLVVAPSGLVQRPGLPGQFGAAIQLVNTWDDLTTVDQTIDLGDVAPGAALQSLAVAPLWRLESGGWVRQPGAALIVAGLTDGSLVTLEADRTAGSEAITMQPPVRQDLGFAALDLAISPDGSLLYVATLDPLPGGVLGVAALDLAGLPGALTVRALSARAGTTQVAAIDVAPFIENNLTAAVPDFDHFGPPEPRVLAALDNRACGRDRSVPCGVAIIDPVAGTLAADPAGLLPYQMPIQVDGEVLDIAVSGAPAVSTVPGYMTLAPGSGVRWTQSIAAISSSSGRIYIADLSHFTLANDISSLNGSSRARVASSASFGPSQQSNPVGVWARTASDVTGEYQLLQASNAAFGIGVTPGFTPNDSWTVAYQGVMPGLGARLGVAWVAAGGSAAPGRVALQEATGLTAPGSEPWRSVVRVYDPRIAIQPHDVIEVIGFPTGICPLGRFDLEVTSILPPSVDAPGGALAVAPAARQPTNVGQTVPADPTCLPAGAMTKVTLTVRASGFIAAGQGVGYVGRPLEVFDPADPGELPFEVRYEDEDALSCPIMPDATDAWPPPAAAIAACEADVATCRATCERLVLARRARRLFYVTNRCSAEREGACHKTWIEAPSNLTFPMPNGPLVSFKLAVYRETGGFDPPERGGFLSFTTASGLSPTVRVPYLGGASASAVLPGGVVLHDRTEATLIATDGIHGFAAFTGNMVLDFASGSSGQSAVTIR
jgi:hypothetical protein